MSKSGGRATGAAAGIAAVIALATPVVIAWEGLRTSPYADLIGKPTVCYGETDAVMRTYTKDECRLMLARSLVKYAEPVLQCLPPDAPVEVKAAFTSLAYNVGTAAACGSTAARKARAGDYAGACDGILAWNKARIAGKLTAVKGLTNRRNAERALCLKGLP